MSQLNAVQCLYRLCTAFNKLFFCFSALLQLLNRKGAFILYSKFIFFLFVRLLWLNQLINNRTICICFDNIYFESKKYVYFKYL